MNFLKVFYRSENYYTDVRYQYWLKEQSRRNNKAFQDVFERWFMSPNLDKVVLSLILGKDYSEMSVSPK